MTPQPIFLRINPRIFIFQVSFSFSAPSVCFSKLLRTLIFPVYWEFAKSDDPFSKKGYLPKINHFPGWYLLTEFHFTLRKFSTIGNLRSYFPIKSRQLDFYKSHCCFPKKAWNICQETLLRISPQRILNPPSNSFCQVSKEKGSSIPYQIKYFPASIFGHLSLFHFSNFNCLLKQKRFLPKTNN